MPSGNRQIFFLHILNITGSHITDISLVLVVVNPLCSISNIMHTTLWDALSDPTCLSLCSSSKQHPRKLWLVGYNEMSKARPPL